MKDRKGFTLIELLVVIAIIVVLIAILVPSLERAIAQAQLASCMANHDGLGTAVEMYLFDHKRKYPDGETGKRDRFGPSSGSRPPHQELVSAMEISWKLFTCPTDATPGNFVWWEYHHDGYDYTIPAFMNTTTTQVTPQVVTVYTPGVGVGVGGVGSAGVGSQAVSSGTTVGENDQKGASYMMSEWLVYQYKKESGSAIVSGQIVEPSKWAWMADGNWTVDARTWHNVDGRQSGGGGRRDWTHANNRLVMSFGDKSASAVQEYTADGETELLRNRYRSHPYQ